MYRAIPRGAYYGMNLGTQGLGDGPTGQPQGINVVWPDSHGLNNYTYVPAGTPEDVVSALNNLIAGVPWSYASTLWPDVTPAMILPFCTPNSIPCGTVPGFVAPPNQTVLPPTTNVQGVYSDPATAQAIASQIVGGTVQPTANGSYAVVAPGNAVATPAVISQISSQPAPAGSSGSVPGPTFYPAPPVSVSTQPISSGGTAPPVTSPTPGATIPPAGNANAAPPSSSMFCFPGDPSGAIMPGVPVCQYTALGVLAGFLILMVAMK